MAHGEVAVPTAAAVQPWKPATCGPVGFGDVPFDTHGQVLLDEVISAAETATGLRFSAYLGDLGDDTRSTAENLLDGLGADAPSAVLVALSPGQRVVEVVTGTVASRRLSDRAARLAVLGVVSSASDGDLLGALVNAIRTLADQAGTLPERKTW